MCCGFVAASGLAQQTALPDKVDFNFKFQPGRSYTQRIVSRNVGAVTLPPPLPEQKMSQTVEETIVSHCTKVNPDGSGEFEIGIQDFSLRMTIGGMTINYDSRTYDPTKPTDFVTRLIGSMFSGIRDVKMHATISSSGEALKFEGMGAVMKNMARNLGKNLPESGQETAQVKSMFDEIGSMFDDNSMASNMGQELQSMYRLTPGKRGPYKIGDNWDHAWTMRLPGLFAEMKGRGDYELVAIEMFRGRPCVKIRSKETFDMGTSAAPASKPAKEGMLAAILRNMDMKISASGGEGYAWLDYTTGEMVQMRATQNITLNMNMQIPQSGKTESSAKPSQAVQISQKFRTSVSADLIEPGAQTQKATVDEGG